MKKLLFPLLLLPMLATAQVELLKIGEPLPKRAVMGDFKLDTLDIIFYDAKTNLIEPGFVVEKSFSCLNSTYDIVGVGDQFLVCSIFLNAQKKEIERPMAFCKKEKKLFYYKQPFGLPNPFTLENRF